MMNNPNHMNSFWQWIYPALFAVVIYSLIRLVTDIPAENEWNSANHIAGMATALVGCYSFYFVCRYYFSRKWSPYKTRRALFTEYTAVILYIIASLTMLLFISHVSYNRLGNPFGDLIISQAIAIPVLLFYYSMIRHLEINRFYRQQSLQLEKIKSDQLNTELQLLKSQYHPHFLFNALNTIYFQIHSENAPARHSVELLSRLLRYQLYDIHQKVTFSQELAYLRSYIEFQSLRVSKRLQLTLDADPQIGEQEIPPLLFQPLVENAFKYVGGDYRINISFRRKESALHFTIQNSISNREKQPEKNRSGIGIKNLHRRLELLYPQRHSLSTKKIDTLFVAELILTLNESWK